MTHSDVEIYWRPLGTVRGGQGGVGGQAEDYSPLCILWAGCSPGGFEWSFCPERCEVGVSCDDDAM